VVGKPEGKRPLGKHRRRWKFDIRKGLKEIGWDGMGWDGNTKTKEVYLCLKSRNGKA
jgi:hypothetical protein